VVSIYMGGGIKERKKERKRELLVRRILYIE
jgi:hypothetical protein